MKAPEEVLSWDCGALCVVFYNRFDRCQKTLSLEGLSSIISPLSWLRKLAATPPMFVKPNVARLRSRSIRVTPALVSTIENLEDKTLLSADSPIPAAINPMSVEEGLSLEIDILNGATDPQGHSISIASVDAPLQGTAVVANITIPDLNDPNGWWDIDPEGNNYWAGATITKQVIEYTAVVGYTGLVALSYTIQDETGAQATGMVDLNITANPPPVATDDTASTEQDTSVQIDVLANDSDPDNESFSITAITQPTQGTVSIATINVPDLNDPNGRWEPTPDGDVWMGAMAAKQVIQYAPTSGFFGQETFTYTITDDRGAEATASVTVNVAGNASPIVSTLGTATLEEGRTVQIDVLDGATDPEGHSISIASVETPAYGIATISTITVPNLNDPYGHFEYNEFGSYWVGESITEQIIEYTAVVGYVGTVTLSYTIQDELGAQATGTVDVSVTANPPPIATDDTASTEQDASVQIDVMANDSDPGNEAFSITAITQPAQGTVTVVTINIPDLNDPYGWWESTPDGDVWMGATVTAKAGHPVCSNIRFFRSGDIHLYNYR